jgi:hypothetical protein
MSGISPTYLHPRNDATEEDLPMDDDRERAQLRDRRERLQALVFGAASPSASESDRARAAEELRRIDAQLGGTQRGGTRSPKRAEATEPTSSFPSPTAPASTGSSATWLAAVAEAKLATWTERSEAAERQAANTRARRAEEASAPLAGEFQFAPFGGGDGDGGEGDDGDKVPLDRTTRAHHFRDVRSRLTPWTAGLALAVVVIAAGAGFGIGANVASERDRAASDIRASDVATPAADDDAADWRALASQQALAEFSRNQLSGDLPPDTVSDDHFRADSFRLLLTGSIADWTGRVYAAKDIEGEICVVLVQPDSSYSAGCATPDQFARGGVQVTTNVSITIRADEDGSESTITGVTATWPANGMTGLRFSSARSAG